MNICISLNGDVVGLGLMELLLVVLIGISIFNELKARFSSQPDLTVERGEESMNFLFTLHYGISALLYALAVQICESEALRGWKVVLI